MKKYYKDYTPDSKVLKNGKVKRDVVYHGDYYCYGDSLESFKWLTKTLVGQTLLFSILFIALGFLNSPGSRSFTVLIPYFCSFLPAAYMWTALTGMYMLLRNSAAGKKKDTIEKMEFARYHRSYCRIKKCAAGMMITMLIAAIGSLILIIMHFNMEGLMREIAFFIGALVMSADAYTIMIVIKKTAWHRIKTNIDTSK